MIFLRKDTAKHITTTIKNANEKTIVEKSQILRLFVSVLSVLKIVQDMGAIPFSVCRKQAVLATGFSSGERN